MHWLNTDQYVLVVDSTICARVDTIGCPGAVLTVFFARPQLEWPSNNGLGDAITIGYRHYKRLGRDRR